jgi:hypothetical protein
MYGLLRGSRGTPISPFSQRYVHPSEEAVLNALSRLGGHAEEVVPVAAECAALTVSGS